MFLMLPMWSCLIVLTKGVNTHKLTLAFVSSIALTMIGAANLSTVQEFEQALNYLNQIAY